MSLRNVTSEDTDDNFIVLVIQITIHLHFVFVTEIENVGCFVSVFKNMYV